MNRILWFAVVATLAFASLGTLSASAKAGDVTRTGPCSAGSDWKLKLSPDNGRIEVEFEVDQNVVGDVWRVRLLHDGDVFFRGRKATKGPSGSFTVRQLANDASGTDRFVAKARNTSTDELCRGTASI